MVDLGAPLGSIWGAREPQKSAKSAVLSSKIKVFAVWRAGAENGRKKPQKEPQDAPRQAQNLPREKTESGVSKSSWCNRALPALMRFVWWSRGKSLAFSGILVVLRCISSVFPGLWWSYGKSLAFSGVLVVLR